MHFDLMVLGSGPGGYSSAIEAAKNGLKVVLFEKDTLGGTCLNVGCIPTKYLLDKAATLEKIRGLTGKGVFKDAGSFSFRAIQKGKSEVVDKLVGGVSALLKASGVTLVRGEALLTGAGKATCDGTEYTAENVIIATGSVPVSIPIPGAEFAIDSTGALALQKIPHRLAVIGGGVIGLELASAFASFGSEVTIVEMLDSLLPLEEKTAADFLVKSLKKRGMKIAAGSRVLSIERSGAAFRVSFQNKDGVGEVEADIVLMAIGRKASFSGLDTIKLGLELSERKYIQVDKHMRTNLPNVYAIGDVAGGYQLAHAAYAEAETAVANILGVERSLDVRAIPRCVYTLPCLAAVGLTSVQAEKEGIETITGIFRYEGNGMALAEGAAGIVCVVMDKNEKTTLGVHIVGENASELISMATVAVTNRMKLEEWEHLIVAHPSLSEMLREAALDAFGKAIHTIKVK